MGRPREWLEQIRWAVLDLSGAYRAGFDTAAPGTDQVADLFHVVRLGNDALDEVRCRVQNHNPGTPRPQARPAGLARKLLVSASENITDSGRARLRGPLDAGDPTARSATPGAAEETLRSIYDIHDAEAGAATVAQLVDDLQDPGLPPELDSRPRGVDL